MPDLYFNEESDYSEENASDNEDFRSRILKPFISLWAWTEKMCGN